MRKFPSINQFRHCVRAEQDQAEFENRAPAKRIYRGTVKLHGTNAGVFWPGRAPELTFMSRSRIIRPGDDNAGFATFFSQPEMKHYLKLAIDSICTLNNISPLSDISVFGEWCGKGIQKNVAVSQLHKMFVIFAAYAEGRWLDDVSISTPVHGNAPIYSIMDFPTFEMEIDFAKPELAQNDLVAITEKVEECCPVGKHFGIEGIGEGVVWQPAGDSEKYWFKVKGDKHSVSKVARLASLDVERFRKRDDMIQALVTENRLEQGLQYHLNEAKLTLSLIHIGSFLRWVINDIAKEEIDTIEANGFTIREIGKPVSEIGKRFFIKAMNEAGVII